jgi:hypothetical protein
MQTLSLSSLLYCFFLSWIKYEKLKTSRKLPILLEHWKMKKNSYVYFCVNFGHFSFNIFKTITIFNLESNYFLTNHIHVSMQREIDSNTKSCQGWNNKEKNFNGWNAKKIKINSWTYKERNDCEQSPIWFNIS